MKKISTIAILEDDPSTLKYNEIVIKHSTFNGESRSFSRTEHFLEYTENNELDRNHLLLIDINPNGQSVFSILDKLRQRYSSPNYKVVILGAMISDEIRSKSKRYEEVLMTMEKPISIPTLNDLMKIDLEVFHE